MSSKQLAPLKRIPPAVPRTQIVAKNCSCFVFVFRCVPSARLSAIAADPAKAIYGKPLLCELRVLKIVPNSLSLRRTFARYWKSFLDMRDLLLYIMFVMFIVAVLCVHMYMGVLQQHCVKKPLASMSVASWTEFTSNPGTAILCAIYACISPYFFSIFCMLSVSSANVCVCLCPNCKWNPSFLHFVIS